MEVRFLMRGELNIFNSLVRGEFIGSTPLVAQNINFDYSFINNNLSMVDSPLSENPLYDTLSLARSFIYFYNSFSLGSLCDYYGIEIENAHRAGNDALCTGKLFSYLLKSFGHGY